MKTHLLVLSVAAISSAALISVSARTWTRASDGATIEGEFVRMKDAETVYIAREGGSTVAIPLAMLSKDDQEYLKVKMVSIDSTEVTKKEAPKGETEVTLSGAHLCCGGCKSSVEDAVEGLDDIELSMSGDNITVKGKSGRDVQKAIDAIAIAGFYGESDNEDVMIPAGGASDTAADSVTVSDVHLCCGKCVRAIDAVVKAVDGAESHTAENDASSFTISGKGIKPSAILAALRAEGMNGTVK